MGGRSSDAAPRAPSPRRGEGRGEGVTTYRYSANPLTRIASRSDLSPPGRGEWRHRRACHHEPTLRLPAARSRLLDVPEWNDLRDRQHAAQVVAVGDRSHPLAEPHV